MRRSIYIVVVNCFVSIRFFIFFVPCGGEVIPVLTSRVSLHISYRYSNCFTSQITADGHCLYRALSDQLHRVANKDMTFEELRSLAASHMRAQPDDYIPFLLSDSGDLLDSEGFESYCNAIVGSEKVVWGGNPEIVALSRALGREIVVYASDAVHRFGEANGEAPLQVTFHKHYFGLGSHYNSAVPQEQ